MSKGENNPFKYFSLFSNIDKNKDGIIDMKELNDMYEGNLEEYEVKK